MKHSSLGVDLPVLSIETADHTGGFYHIKGLHPASIAALGGKGPEIQKQERFDVKCNVNKKRTCVSLIVNTTKHLPHVDWNSDTGAGKRKFLSPKFKGRGIIDWHRTLSRTGLLTC